VHHHLRRAHLAPLALAAGIQLLQSLLNLVNTFGLKQASCAHAALLSGIEQPRMTG
jgi:hypothetical protein